MPVQISRGTGPLAPGRPRQYAVRTELDRLLRAEADLVNLRALLGELWGPVRVFQSALDQAAGWPAGPIPGEEPARETASRLARALARNPGEAAAARAFLCEFYELAVALDAQKAGLARQKAAAVPRLPDLRPLRACFHRLGVYLHHLQLQPVLRGALDPEPGPAVPAPEPPIPSPSLSRSFAFALPITVR